MATISASLSKALLERKTRSYVAFAELRRIISFFLAADVGEELIDIMNNSYTSTSFPPTYLALNGLKPISLVAPVIT